MTPGIGTPVVPRVAACDARCGSLWCLGSQLEHAACLQRLVAGVTHGLQRCPVVQKVAEAAAVAGAVETAQSHPDEHRLRELVLQLVCLLLLTYRLPSLR